ncbi:DUF397 domain-containing protein [Actinomadura sp. NPDC049382]|uniref:DUF397 domain-containing protein n=1 Tax=Actinomadura sp. NPDC049382 TaxID=3158220 RepID=UPI0034217EE5
MKQVKWRKVQQSNDHGGSGVELVVLTEAVAVWDSKDLDGPRLLLDPVAFRVLLGELKRWL